VIVSAHIPKHVLPRLGHLPFVHKPFTPDDVARALSRLITT
jgi:hypothetical protein